MTKDIKKDLVYFSASQVGLLQEIAKHEELKRVIQRAQVGGDDWGALLAEVGAYCGVMLDGEYKPEELDRLCNILIFKLKEKGVVIVS